MQNKKKCCRGLIYQALQVKKIKVWVNNNRAEQCIRPFYASVLFVFPPYGIFLNRINLITQQIIFIKSKLYLPPFKADKKVALIKLEIILM